MFAPINRMPFFRHLHLQSAVAMLCFFIISFTPIQLIALDDPCEEAGHVLSTSTTTPGCFGDTNGTATVASTGCDCMFSGCTYEWSDGQTFHTAYNLEPGTYSVIVTHPDGCVLEIEAVVESEEEYIQNIELQHISCKGENTGSITIVPSEESSDQLSYAWSTGASTATVDELSPGEYTVLVTDFGGCTTEDTFLIEEPAEELSLIYELEPSCSGAANGIIRMFPEGGTPPYTYQCDNSIIQTANQMDHITGGQHSIVVRDANQCMVQMFVEIEETLIETPQINSGGLYICQGEMTNLNGFAAGEVLAYEWSPAIGLSNPHSNAVLANPEETTTYTLTASYPEGCESKAEITVVVDICSGLSESGTNAENSNIFSIYPNPTQGTIHLNITHPSNIYMYNSSGKKIKHWETFNNFSSPIFDLGDTPNGVYFIQVINEYQNISQKLIKN